MGRKSDLNVSEKNEIVRLLAKGFPTLEIAKSIGRDHRTVKKVCGNMLKEKKVKEK